MALDLTKQPDAWLRPIAISASWREIISIKRGASMLIVKSIIYTILVPAIVMIFLPILLLMQSPISGLPSLRMTQALCLIPLAVGTAILLHSIWMFASVGRGTLVSWDAPRNFVV